MLHVRLCDVPDARLYNLLLTSPPTPTPTLAPTPTPTETATPEPIDTSLLNNYKSNPNNSINIWAVNLSEQKKPSGFTPENDELYLFTHDGNIWVASANKTAIYIPGKFKLESPIPYKCFLKIGNYLYRGGNNFFGRVDLDTQTGRKINLDYFDSMCTDGKNVYYANKSKNGALCYVPIDNLATQYDGDKASIVITTDVPTDGNNVEISMEGDKISYTYNGTMTLYDKPK